MAFIEAVKTRDGRFKIQVETPDGKQKKWVGLVVTDRGETTGEVYCLVKRGGRVCGTPIALNANMWRMMKVCRLCPKDISARRKRQARERKYRPPANCEAKYGITADAARILFQEQGYACACCGRKGKQWRIDHVDTLWGPVVRGILCNTCNSGWLGGNGDTPGGLLKAARERPGVPELRKAYRYLVKTEPLVIQRNGGTYPIKPTRRWGNRVKKWVA